MKKALEFYCLNFVFQVYTVSPKRKTFSEKSEVLLLSSGEEDSEEDFLSVENELKRKLIS